MVRRTTGKGTQQEIMTENMRARYHSRLEQIDRWRKEYEYHQGVEARLAAVSKFSYDPVDYTLLLERVPWLDKPVPTFDYLIENARERVEKQFFFPIAIRVAALLVIMLTVFISAAKEVHLLAGILGFTIFVSFYIMVKDRRDAMHQAIAAAESEKALRIESARRMNEEQRQRHEQQENERIETIRRIMEGEFSAVILRLNEVLPKLGFPFIVEIDINLYEQIPLVRVWLPQKTIIPRQKCSLSPSGRVLYDDKEIRQINKEYLELCASIIIQVMTTIYSNIPAWDICYANGMLKNGSSDDCLMTFKISRETLIAASRADSGLAALQIIQAKFETDAFLALVPVEPELPPGWDEIEQQNIQGVHFRLFR